MRLHWIAVGFLPVILPAQAAWVAAHVAPNGPGTPQLCYQEAEERLFAVARRNPLSELETWERDGQVWRQRHTQHAPCARSSCALGYDSARRRVVLFGGIDERGVVLGDTWEWDGVDWSQRLPAVAPSPRYAAAHAFDAARGRFVVYGGVWSGEQWEWDGVVWQQVALGASHPGVRAGGQMTYDSARHALVLFGGGNGVSFAPPLRDTWEFVGGAWHQRATAVAPPSLRGAAIAYDRDSGRSVLCGGRIADTLPSLVHTEVWDWDGNQWRRHTMTPNPGERQPPGFAYDPRLHRFVLHGSFDKTDTWELDPATWTWAQQPYVAAKSLVALAVGDFAGGALLHSPDETLRWDFAARRWQNVTTPTRPTSSGSTMAFDPMRRQALLLTANAQTWIWDDVAESWSRRQTAHSPPPTQFGAMAFDLLRQRMVFFGGQTNLGVTSQVWEWDGLDWTDATPAFGPGGRVGAALAFDLASGTIVMFGGSRAPSALAYENDVWDWDGVRWTPRFVSGAAPAGRYGAALVTAAGRVLLFGGQITPTLSGGMSDELWELRGTTWLPLEGAPIGCREPVFVADAVTGDMALFGGVVNNVGGSHVAPSVWAHGEARALVLPFGSGCATGTQPPELAALGAPTLGNPSFALLTTTNAPLAPTAFAIGLAPLRTEVDNRCSLFVDVLVVQWTVASPGGSASLPFALPAGPGFLGLSLNAQAAVLGTANGTLSLTGGLQLVLGR
jgi:hypothetical protein